LLRKNYSISFGVIIAWRKKSRQAFAGGKALILVLSRILLAMLLLELERRDRRRIPTLQIVALIARREGTGTDVAHLIQALEVVVRRVQILSSLLCVSPQGWHQILRLLLTLPLTRQASLILMFLLLRHELLRYHRVIDRGYL